MGKNKEKKTFTSGMLPLPASVGIVYSEVRREYFPTEAQYITEKDSEQDARLIAGYLEALEIQVRLYPGDAELAERLQADRPELVLNLVDSIKGREDLAAAIPGVLELLSIPYTGGDMLCMTLDTNKFLVNELLRQNGVPVPNFQLFATAEDPLDPSLRFPLISKLNAIHGSVEITTDAVSETEKHLRKRLRYLLRTYQQPVLVEEFIAGREITAIVLGNRPKRVFAAEKLFLSPHGKYAYLTFDEQWLMDSSQSFFYRKYKDSLLKEYVKRAFDVTKMYDYAKFDIRLDQSGRYFFIDSNCNPALGPKEQDVAISLILDLYGVSFAEMLERMLASNLQTAGERGRHSNSMPEQPSKTLEPVGDPQAAELVADELVQPQQDELVQVIYGEEEG